MTILPVSPQAAAAELLRRRRARASLIDFAKAIDVPGKPIGDDEDESWIFAPVETGLAAHHLLLLDTLQKLALGELVAADGTVIRDAMVFMPPGSAKSTYGSVVFPTWFMGRNPRSRVILASYASDIARKQGRRARQIVRSAKYCSIFDTSISNDTSAADEWALSNESEFMAGGILSGVTGNRAHGLIIDDPVAGREEADSETIRVKTRAAYDDDLTTRLVPGAWTLLVTTRWHFDDLAGGILPENWSGESGDIRCRDGRLWRVLCLPAIAGQGDPLGRKPGELLWPEWFTPEFFSRYQSNVRTWSALYQQQPAPDTGDYFRREWLHEVDQLPPLDTLAVYGASDYAVTADGGDYTVHVIVGVDRDGRLWLLDLWRGQTSAFDWIEAFCDLALKWKPIGWAEETGQIRAGVGPFLTARQRERDAFVYRETFPTKNDKAVRAQSIRGRMAMNGLYFSRSAPWKAAFVSELMSFPVGVHDDQVDALGLVGQLLDRMQHGRTPHTPEEKPAAPPGYMPLPGLPTPHSGTRLRI